MDLVEIGHGTMRLGHVAQLRDRRDIAVHGIYGLERDELRRVSVKGRELPVEIRGIVMREYLLFGTAVADAFDHRGMILRI